MISQKNYFFSFILILYTIPIIAMDLSECIESAFISECDLPNHHITKTIEIYHQYQQTSKRIGYIAYTLNVHEKICIIDELYTENPKTGLKLFSQLLHDASTKKITTLKWISKKDAATPHKKVGTEKNSYHNSINTTSFFSNEKICSWKNRRF